MNHNIAIESKAAEQYVLGQMSDAERDAYEEHMFSCAACSEEVKYLAEFGEGLKTVFVKPGADKLYQLEKKPSFWHVLWQPLPRYACAAALLVSSFAAYEGVVIRNLRQVQVFAIVPHKAILTVPRDGQSILSINDGQAIVYLPAKTSRVYDVKLSTKSGKTIVSRRISAAENATAVQIVPPAEYCSPEITFSRFEEAKERGKILRLG